MGLKDTAKELIDANVYANGTEKITGQGLNATLKGMVDILPTLEEINSGIKGEALTTTTPAATGFERYIVHTAGTYTNFLDSNGQPITVIEAEFDKLNGVPQNRVIISVFNGVASKSVERTAGEPGPDGTSATANIPHLSTIADGTTLTAPSQFIDAEDNLWAVKDGQTWTKGTDALEESDKIKRVNDFDRFLLSREGLPVQSYAYPNFDTPSTHANLTGIMVNKNGIVEHAGTIKKITINANVAVAVVFVIVEKLQNGQFKAIEGTDFRIDTQIGIHDYEVNIVVEKNQGLGMFYSYSPLKLVPGQMWFFTFDLWQAVNTPRIVDGEFNEAAPYQFTVERNTADLADIITATKEIKQNKKLSRIFYLEDFGAEPLNPLFPDQGRDCTKAFQDFINYVFDPFNAVESAVLRLRGMYRLAGPFKHVAGLSYAQVVLPTIPYSPNMKIRSVNIISDHEPIWEDQGIIEMPVSYASHGFYCDRPQPDPNIFNFVLSLNWGGAYGTFEMFNNVNFHMDKIAIIVRNHDLNGNTYKNCISGIDASSNSHFSWGSLMIRTSTSVFKTLYAPSERTFGLALPQFMNHATVYGDYLRCYGFGRGLQATEHLQLGTYIGSGNLIGIFVEYQYPVTINTVCLEMNKTPIMMQNLANLNMLVFQTERKTGNHWYAQTGNDIVQESPAGSSMVNIMKAVCHSEGGNAVTMNWDENVNVKIMADEFGNANMTNKWTSLPANPTEGMEGYINGEKKVYINGVWKTISLL